MFVAYSVLIFLDIYIMRFVYSIHGLQPLPWTNVGYILLLKGNGIEIVKFDRIASL